MFRAVLYSFFVWFRVGSRFQFLGAKELEHEPSRKRTRTPDDSQQINNQKKKHISIWRMNKSPAEYACISEGYNL